MTDMVSRSGIPLHIQGVSKRYGNDIHVLREADLSIEPGEHVAIMGPSGCGKSTFLHMVGLLDRPDEGQIVLGTQEVSRASEAVRHRIRNQQIGFIFQSHNLLQEHTAAENVGMPIRIAGGSKREAMRRASMLLEAVGLSDRKKHLPGELSGGEQQRVAIARAFAMGPRLVLADEPTGNLDPRTSNTVFDLFMHLNKALGTTLVVVTHSVELAAQFQRQLHLNDGKFEEQKG